MNRQRTFGQYRSIDLTILLIVQVASQFVIHFAATVLYTDQLYVVSPVAAVAALVMMLGIFVGISFTGSQELFYNALLMPLIGGLGFLVFRWKAVWQVPLLLLAVGLAALGLDILRGLGQLDLPSLLWWTVIYSGFAAAGVLIAALLCFALKKED